MAGPDGNYPSGHVLDVDKIVGKQLIDGGYAESLEIVEEKEPAIENIIPKKKR